MSSGFNVIRRHSSDETNVRIKELTQALAKARSDISGSQLETDDIRSQGRMDHSTIKINDERLKFLTTLNAANTDFFYEFPIEPDFNYLKVWFMLDHLGARMRDMSGFGHDAYITGHPTLRRAGLDLGFQQTGGGVSATPVMLFNSGTDVVSQTNGEYIWIPDHFDIQFTRFSAGFSIAFRFNCLNFNAHIPYDGIGSYSRRFAAKTDDATNGWNLLVYSTNAEGTQGGVEFEILHDNVQYARRTTGYSINTWYQVIVTYNPNVTADQRIKIYTAGIENSLSSTYGTILPTHTNLRIGARDSETGFFQGYIHDFRLYMGKVLTQSEITNLNQNELTIDSVEKGHIFVIQYALVSQVLRSRTHKYNVGGDVKRERTHKYNIVRKITRTRTHKFTILNRITRTRTHKYNILQKVSRTRTHKFSVGGKITVTKTHRYGIGGKVNITKTHKYNIVTTIPKMEYKRFLKSTNQSTPVTQEITFNQTPQAIIVWSDGSTNNDTFTSWYHCYYGFSDGTRHACISGHAASGQVTTGTFSGHKTDKVISMLNTASGLVVAEATVAFSANKATFTWTTNDDRAVYIHCMAIYNVNDVCVESYEYGTTATGNKVYNLPAGHTTTTGKFIQVIGNGSPASWSTAYGNSIIMGSATSSTNRWVIANCSEDNQGISDTTVLSKTDKVLSALDDDNPTVIEQEADFASFGSGNFTLNYTTVTSLSTRMFSTLVIDDPKIDIGTITEPASTGTQVINTAANVDNVSAVMLYSVQSTTSSGIVNQDAAISIGGASGTGSTDQGVISTRDRDAADITVAARINKTGAVIKSMEEASPETSSTTTSEASVSAMGTDQFTLNWSSRDSTRKSFYFVIGQ